MDAIDELQRAGATAPPTAETLASVRDAVLSEASVLPTQPERRPRRLQHRVLTSVAAFALVGGGSAVMWKLSQSDPKTTTTIECGYNTYIPDETGNPVLDCRDALLRQGGSVPPLVAWVTPSGLVAVLPKDDHPPDGSTLLPSGFTVSAGVRYLTDSLGDTGGPLVSQCLSPGAATQWAQTQLAVAGLEGWAVQAETPDHAACSAFAAVVDAPSATVTLQTMAFVSPTGGPADVLQRLDSLLRSQMVSGPDASCLSTPSALALASSDAARLGIASSAVTVSDGGTVGPGPRCATPFVEPSGFVDVVVWQAPRT